MNIADELQKLQQLHQSGTLSDEEFAQAKNNLLNPPPGGLGAMFGSGNAGVTEQQARTWAVLLHLSQFAGYLVPLAGLVLPIVIWQIKKAEIPELDVHGQNVVNWIISEILYVLLCMILFFVVIGVPLLLIVLVLGIIFPIIGAIKANNGEAWKYPLSIPFFK